MADEIKDRRDIIDLALTWSSTASSLDAQALSHVFTPDGILAGVTKLAPGGKDVDLVGPKNIEAFFAPIFEALQFVHHTSQVVELKLSGDTATAQTMIVEYARPKGGNLLLVVGDYLDQMVRTAQGWRFTRRELVTKAWTFIAEVPMA